MYVSQPVDQNGIGTITFNCELEQTYDYDKAMGAPPENIQLTPTNLAASEKGAV